jgi:hypothetical protein
MKIVPVFRNRTVYAVFMIIVTICGLASRHYAEILPDFIANYAGDTLWALMVFFLIGWLFSALAIWQVASMALTFAFVIECSQLYHAPWLDEWRHYWLVALIIGRGFLWSDLICYSVGVAMGAVGEWLWLQYGRNGK